MVDRSPGRWRGFDIAMAVGGLGMVAGPFLPYITAASGLGRIERSGIELVAPEIFIVIGAGAFIAWLAWQRVQSGHGMSAVPMLLALVGGGLTLYYYLQVSDRVDSLTSDVAVGSIGTGLWITAAGVLVALLGSWNVRQATKRGEIGRAPTTPAMPED